jgi:CheY-like chemotaxis protein
LDDTCEDVAGIFTSALPHDQHLFGANGFSWQPHLAGFGITQRTEMPDLKVGRPSQVVKSVLIVDDNVFIRRALCDIFNREEGFDVCGEASNGREAIEKAQELHPNLIVLDLSMPVMNGLDAARVLRRSLPNASLIMYSAFADRYAEQQARLIGISAVVSKSEPPAALVGKAITLFAQTAA